jgi:hypothetical protein
MSYPGKKRAAYMSVPVAFDGGYRSGHVRRCPLVWVEPGCGRRYCDVGGNRVPSYISPLTPTSLAPALTAIRYLSPHCPHAPRATPHALHGSRHPPQARQDRPKPSNPSSLPPPAEPRTPGPFPRPQGSAGCVPQSARTLAPGRGKRRSGASWDGGHGSGGGDRGPGTGTGLQEHNQNQCHCTRCTYHHALVVHRTPIIMSQKAAVTP